MCDEYVFVFFKNVSESVEENRSDLVGFLMYTYLFRIQKAEMVILERY